MSFHFISFHFITLHYITLHTYIHTYACILYIYIYKESEQTVVDNPPPRSSGPRASFLEERDAGNRCKANNNNNNDKE